MSGVCNNFTVSNIITKLQWKVASAKGISLSRIEIITLLEKGKPLFSQLYLRSANLIIAESYITFSLLEKKLSIVILCAQLTPVILFDKRTWLRGKVTSLKSVFSLRTKMQFDMEISFTHNDVFIHFQDDNKPRRIVTMLMRTSRIHRYWKRCALQDTKKVARRDLCECPLLLMKFPPSFWINWPEFLNKTSLTRDVFYFLIISSLFYSKKKAIVKNYERNVLSSPLHSSSINLYTLTMSIYYNNMYIYTFMQALYN